MFVPQLFILALDSALWFLALGHPDPTLCSVGYVYVTSDKCRYLLVQLQKLPGRLNVSAWHSGPLNALTLRLQRRNLTINRH